MKIISLYINEILDGEIKNQGGNIYSSSVYAQYLKEKARTKNT